MSTDLATAASQYADAVMQLAVTANAENAVLDDLKAVSEVVAKAPDLGIVLNHPSVEVNEKKQLVVSIFGGKVNDLTLRLLELLCDRRRLELIPYIAREYHSLWREKQNIVAGTLLYAERPEDRVLNQIKSTLAAKLGKTLELDEKEDKSLIGGFVLRLGDQVIDGSLRGKLQSIEKALLSV